jgi:Domain of unknown function (DUF1844)
MPEEASKATAPDKLPPPSFSLLVATFASQATVAFGHMPNPIDGKTEVRLDLAKHAIDMLDMIQEKTLGNLAPEEASMLENVLHQLRMAYVDASAKK